MTDYAYGTTSWYATRDQIIDMIIETGVTIVCNSAFEGCTSLSTVAIGNSVTSIGEYAFQDCSSLTTVTNFAETPQAIAVAVFDGVDLSASTLYVPVPAVVAYEAVPMWTDFGTIAGLTWDCGDAGSNVTATLDANGVLTVSGTGAMADYSRGWMSGAPWESIGNHIKEVIIGSGVTTVGSYAFDGCSSATTVTIGNSVTEIGGSAFNGCESLTSITNHATTPQEISSNTFRSVDLATCRLYVPATDVAAYQAADVWGDFTNIEAIGSSSAQIWPCGDGGNNVMASLANGKLTISGRGL